MVNVWWFLKGGLCAQTFRLGTICNITQEEPQQLQRFNVPVGFVTFALSNSFILFSSLKNIFTG